MVSCTESLTKYILRVIPSEQTAGIASIEAGMLWDLCSVFCLCLGYDN